MIRWLLKIIRGSNYHEDLDETEINEARMLSEKTKTNTTEMSEAVDKLRVVAHAHGLDPLALLLHRANREKHHKQIRDGT